MKVWTIETRGKVHCYRTEKAYQQWWKHHKEFAEWYNTKISKSDHKMSAVGCDPDGNVIDRYPENDNG